MGRTTGQPEPFLGTPEGHGTSRRGAPPSGAGGVLTGPIPYTIRTAAATPWNAGPPGVLGSEPPALLGLYDRRPWEGQPGDRNRTWYRQAARPVYGETLSLRLTREQPQMYREPPYSSTFAGFVDPWSVAVLAAVVAGWEEGDLDVAPPDGSIPSDPFATASGRWTPARAAIIGPNLMPDLMWRGRSELDLGAWSAGARFVAVWLWAFWIGKALPATQVRAFATVLDRPAFEVEPGGPAIVTVPRWTIPDGPLPALVTDAYGVWRVGGWPWLGSPSSYRWAVVNGGSVPCDLETVYHLGPMPDPTNRTTLFDRPTVAPGETWVSPRATTITAGHSGLGIYAANTAAAGFAGGPILLSASGPG